MMFLTGTRIGSEVFGSWWGIPSPRLPDNMFFSFCQFLIRLLRANLHRLAVTVPIVLSFLLTGA